MARLPELDEDLVKLLHDRDGVETVVMLQDGRRLVVYDIAWGYDIGDQWAHVTTNISPGREGAAVDVFLTSEVASLIDPGTDQRIYTAS
ncbi:hypothetical protein JIG36_01210 [Actinoplanes sp. LDG1-06]|uniref:Uncharacterized protein n=1 Tax=Paractinoplanes ovalisporus TaxID=2810368 RepID=A0ABS2A2W0_9ACTN|nr:hypothetical protein [Actinoplanes ovalisporus]MBM2614173.1 hypothetical protein [Actinoplanes ovalisporus]